MNNITPIYKDVRRPWRERLFTRPWRPFASTKPVRDFDAEITRANAEYRTALHEYRKHRREVYWNQGANAPAPAPAPARPALDDTIAWPTQPAVVYFPGAQYEPASAPAFISGGAGDFGGAGASGAWSDSYAAPSTASSYSDTSSSSDFSSSSCDTSSSSDSCSASSSFD